jgi:hypothetical protein
MKDHNEGQIAEGFYVDSTSNYYHVRKINSQNFIIRTLRTGYFSLEQSLAEKLTPLTV